MDELKSMSEHQNSVNQQLSMQLKEKESVIEILRTRNDDFSNSREIVIVGETTVIKETENIQNNKVQIGESYESFDCKRALLVKYHQSQSEVIQVHVSHLKKPVNFENSNS